MRAARRTQSGSQEAAGRLRYLIRGRVRFLAVSEGGRSLTVMVGPLRGPEHLALIRRARFYHVPVSAIAASRTAVAYIAFYEGASRFGRETGMIREYAAVLSVSRVQRSELPGLTWPARGAPEAPYYRFDLGPIRKLPRPIANPDRLRLGFRFPDLEGFRQARTLRELGPRGASLEADRGPVARGEAVGEDACERPASPGPSLRRRTRSHPCA